MCAFDPKRTLGAPEASALEEVGQFSEIGRAYTERAPTSTDERYVFGSAPRVQRRSTGLECKSLDCLPKYYLCGSSLGTSHTGSPSTSHLCPCRSTRTMEPVRSPACLGLKLMDAAATATKIVSPCRS